MSKGGAPQGIVFTQNITTFGGRVNAVQHGDQYNYIYRAEPPYQVEPFPLGHPTTPAPGLTRVPSRLLTARHQVVPFFPRPELELLAAWRDDAVPGMSVRLLHGEGGRGRPAWPPSSPRVRRGPGGLWHRRGTAARWPRQAAGTGA